MLEIYSDFRFLVGEETIFFSTSGWTILTATVYEEKCFNIERKQYLKFFLLFCR